MLLGLSLSLRSFGVVIRIVCISFFIHAVFRNILIAILMIHRLMLIRD